MTSQSTMKEVGGRSKKDGQGQRVTMSTVMIEAWSKMMGKCLRVLDNSSDFRRVGSVVESRSYI